MKKVGRNLIFFVSVASFLGLNFTSIININEICLADNGDDGSADSLIFADFRYNTNMYTVDFDASRSYNANCGDIVNYSWDFQDDGVYEKWGNTVSWTYDTKGMYTVKLRIQNINGETDFKKYILDVPTSYIILTDKGKLKETKSEIENCTKGYDVWVSDEMENFLPIYDALLYKVGDLSADIFKDIIKSVSNIHYIEQNYPCFRSDRLCQLDWQPNDPSYNQQWNLEMIDCPAAWEVTKGDYNNVTVSVIDSGVDYTHPDLAECIWINEDEIPDNCIDDDGNGFVDDVRGWNFCFMSYGNDSKDDCNHGTHCAGIIGACMNNSVGISGVAKTKIMSVKVINAFGGGYVWGVCCGIIYSVNNGANIISMSLGFDSILPHYISPRVAILNSVCKWAYDQDCVIIAASGNDYAEEPLFPARFDSVISVGAVDGNGSIAEFSNRGADVLAPGVSILSTMPCYWVVSNFYINNCTGRYYEMDYDRCSGTSMACPHVAGVAALIKAKYPDKKASWIKSKIIDCVDSRGIINAYKAVTNDTNEHYFSGGFPAGTKITMADGTKKNIENVKIGNKVLSYDFTSDDYSRWRVKMIVKNMHPLIAINNGCIKASADHPLYIKKLDGSEGWAVYRDFENAITFNVNLLKLEVGDHLLNEEGKWIEIENIRYNTDLVQTYNLLSFSGKKSYFANDVLAYEKHLPHTIANYLLYILRERFPSLERFLGYLPFFEPIFQFLT
ncbi:MAG: S8 family serine peptidase [Candidatus Thermoplasmatota archaeon]|nr:S8 family serine peptidase [Candidatus Thermoplasmatota archaeon]